MKPPERLLSVPGFRSAQRFRGTGARHQHYLALYDVESPEVMSSPAYLGIGGGNFLTDVWKPLIQMWQRNLFERDTLAPRVPQDGALVLVDAATPDMVLPGCAIEWMLCVGLDRTTPFRGLAVVTRAAADAVVSAASAIGVFRARTPCMVAPTP